MEGKFAKENKLAELIFLRAILAVCQIRFIGVGIFPVFCRITQRLYDSNTALCFVVGGGGLWDFP